jgi:hypothetical protein
MTRYRVAADRTLEEEGKLSFQTTGLGTGRASTMYISSERAYTMDAGNMKLIEWNPTTMSLTGNVVDISAMRRAGLPASIGPAIKVGAKWMAPIYWEDFDKRIIYAGSGVIVVDPAGGAPTLIENTQLGGAFRINADAAGNAFVLAVTGGDVRLIGKAVDANGTQLATKPSSGMLRLPAGASQFDADSLVAVESVTGSLFMWALFRLDASTLLAQVYAKDGATPTPQTFDSLTDFVWVKIDIATHAVTPVPELGRGGRSNVGDYVIDGTRYVQAANADGSATVYAVSSTGIAPAFPVASGDVWFFQRLR